MTDLAALAAALVQTREWLARPEADFTWSSWVDQAAALREMDAVIDQAERGIVPNVGVLYAPTGPIQEVSLGSGWGDRFLELADRVDRALQERDPRRP